MEKHFVFTKRIKGYGRSKTSLVLFSLLSSVCFGATSSEPPTPHQTPFDDESFLFKIIISIAAIIIAQAAIPAVRGYLHSRRQRKSFSAYLRAHVRNSLASYGVQPCSIDGARTLLGESPDWIIPLEKSGNGVPDTLIAMHKAVTRACTELAHNDGYIPFLSYLGISHTALEHTSPLWDMSEKESMLVSRYLITQEQVLSSLNAQYEESYLKLIESDSMKKRQQWCDAAFSIIEDMAEHYVNAIALQKMISK